jgi:cytidylate kinase
LFIQLVNTPAVAGKLVRRLIVTISGLPGSGKSTLAKGLAKCLGFRHHSAGEFMRQIAAERKTSILELSKIAEKDGSIDREIDNRTKKLAAGEDNFVMDSRMAWYFIPKSVKLFVEVDLGKAAERIFKDMRADEKENTSVEKTLENLKRRVESERARYMKLYGVDYLDRKNYDLVLDSTRMNKQETLERALGFVRRKA